MLTLRSLALAVFLQFLLGVLLKNGLVDQALEPKSGASNIPVVFHVGDRDRHIRVRHHLVCAVHAFAFTVGLFGRGQVLVTMDAGELLHLCRR